MAIGRNGVLLLSSNRGSNWALSIIAGSEDLRGLLILDDTQQPGLIAGPEVKILRSTDQGATWNPVSIGAVNTAESLASE